jgi:hypothetical protein
MISRHSYDQGLFDSLLNLQCRDHLIFQALPIASNAGGSGQSISQRHTMTKPEQC